MCSPSVGGGPPAQEAGGRLADVALEEAVEVLDDEEQHRVDHPRLALVDILQVDSQGLTLVFAQMSVGQTPDALPEAELAERARFGVDKPKAHLQGKEAHALWAPLT